MFFLSPPICCYLFFPFGHSGKLNRSFHPTGLRNDLIQGGTARVPVTPYCPPKNEYSEGTYGRYVRSGSSPYIGVDLIPPLNVACWWTKENQPLILDTARAQWVSQQPNWSRDEEVWIHVMDAPSKVLPFRLFPSGCCTAQQQNKSIRVNLCRGFLCVVCSKNIWLTNIDLTQRDRTVYMVRGLGNHCNMENNNMLCWLTQLVRKMGYF